MPPEGQSLFGVPTGATLAGAAFGSPAYSSVVPSGAELVGDGLPWEDEFPDRCAATASDGRCKNKHKLASKYCGIHKTAWEASDFLDEAAKTWEE